MVFAKNEDGEILPQSRRAQRNAAISKGYAEANKNWQAYSDDLEVLKELNKQLDNNGQAITDNEQRMAKANEVTKNASQRAKDYGKQIATNAKTLTDFKRENEVEKPAQQKQGKWSDGLKSMASTGLSMLGNAFISAGVGILVQGAFSLLGKGIDAIVHKNEDLIAKGQEAKESIQSQTKAYEDQKASLGELTSKYTELSKGVKISGNSIKNISLTNDEYKDFLNTSNQIAAAAPSLTRSWDSQGNAILNAGTNAEDLNTQVNDYLKLQRNLTYYDTKKNISDQYKGYETALGENEGKRDEYKNAYDAAKYKVDSVQKFSDMLKKHTKGEDTITYTLDQTAYDALGNTFGKAIKGYKQSADGQKITLEFDGKQLDFLNNEAASVLNSDNSELQEAHTNLVNTQESIDASKREMVSSIKSMASTIDSFDSWDDQDKASEFQSQLNSMLSSSDGTRLLDNFEQSGKDMDTWLRNNVVNPMATATPDQQKLWSQLFEMEPKDQETVREFAARRKDVLESIADISQSDFWTEDTLGEAFGFAHTEYDENGKAHTVWENKDKLNRVEEALKNAKSSKIKGDASDVRKDLNNMTQDELEIAVQVITDNKDLSSIDDFYTAFEKAKQAAKDMSDQAAVSLDSMETKVSTAKSTLSSMGTILTETTSAGGVSKDNVKILSTAFKNVKDPRGIEQNVNDLFTTTSDGIKLNIDALKTFTEYQAEATDGDFEKGIKLQTKAIAEQTEETDKAWKAIAKADDKEAARATYNAEKDKLKDARDEYLSYMQSQSEWQATKKQQQELLSYYSQWQRAQSTENAGDKYNNFVSGLKNAKDAYDKGLVGTDDFKTFAALISPTGSDDAKNFAENYGKAVRYLTEDKTGVNNFLADLKAKGMASYSKSDDRWSFNIDDMDKAAQSMGIGTEFMKANFGRLRDYGIDNNFISSTEEGISRVKELSLALAEEEKRLDSLDDNLATNDTTRSASQKKIAQYKEDLKETTDNLSEYYGEDYTQQAVADFDGAAIAVQQLDKSIDKVKKDSTLTAAEKNSMISKMIAEQTELAAEQYSSIEDLRNHDTSSLTEGLETDPNATVSAIEQINQAYKDQNTEVTDLIDTLSQYSAEQLEGIDFNDGKWDTELGDAEKAVESLCDKLGLTKNQTQEVIEALEEAGKLKDTTDSSDESSNTEKIKNEAKEAQEDFNSLTGKSYKIDLDTTDLDTAHKQVEDLSSEVDKYRDRDGKYHSDLTGGEELQTMYTGAVSHEQDVEYSSSDISQADSSSSIVKAAQDFMQAKNEMDVQTQLYQKGMDNTLDQATQDANTAFETLQQAQTDSGIKLVDTNNIQTAEDQLLQMSNDDIQAKVNVEADTSEAESDIENLQNVSGSTVTLNCDVSDEGSFEQAKSTIESMPSDTTATIDMEVNGEEDVEKATELIESAPTNGAKLVVDCEVNNKEEFDELMQAQSTANSKGANVEVHASIKGVDVDSAATADTEVPVKGKLEIEPYSGDAVEINAKANITGVVGGEGVQVSLNAKANVTEAPTVPDTTVKATAHVDEAPTVPDAEGIANYEGIFPHVADDAYGVAHYEGDFPTSAPTISGTINYYAHIIGAPSGGAIATASGTMTSVAHASGTAYNVLNMKPLSSAHAKGEVALKHDEQALINEVEINGHSESIVRDGVWSLIPGGAHIENLKKGDIIFSATQTEDLLKHGATHGHARAYAQGTASGITLAPAHASGKTALDELIKKLNTNAADWAETKITRRNAKTESYKSKAESDYTSYKKSHKNYYYAIQSIKKEIEYQKEAKKKYTQYADQVAAQVGLSETLKKKVQEGTIDVQQLSEADKKRVDAYSEWYNKIVKCDEAIQDLREDQKGLANDRVNNVYERYDAIADRYASQQEYYQALRDNRVAKGQSQYVKIGKNDKYANSVWYQQMQKESSSARKELSIKKEELKQVRSNMKKYLAMQGTSKYDTAYQKMVKEAIDLKTVIVNLDTNIQKLDQSMQDAREQLLQWRADRWDRAGAKQDAVIDYAKANDNPNYQVNEKLYQERIKTNSRQIVALQKLKQDMAEYYDAHFESYNNEEAQKYLDKMAQIDEQILKLGSDTEALKNEIMELRWKPFEDYQDKLSSVINEYQTAQKLLGDSDSFYNDDGSFTENGLTNILLTQEQIDTTKDKIANYRAALDKLDEQYKNGCYSKEEYKQKSEELLKSLQQESSTLSSLRQNMLDMYETQVKKENDLLQENIDKRKNALSAKEKYYDYDKTLKKKSKDINTLKAQIAALEGTSNAAAKARLEKLRAELSDAEDDMADTMHQHEVDMKNTGYENFSTEANKALDNTLDAVKKNSAFQEAIIGNMLSNVKTNYDSTYKHLHDVMDQYGLKVSQTYDQMIGKAADFNTAAVNATKAWEGIANIKVNLPAGTSNGNGGSTTGGGNYNKAEDILHNNYNDNKTSNGAGNQTNLDGENYTLTLDKHSVYLLDGGKDTVTLKATWKPKVPQHSEITWISSNTRVVTVNKGKLKSGNTVGTAIVTAKGVGGTDTCKVYVLPYSNYIYMRETAKSRGVTLSDDDMRAGLEYSYKNGKGADASQASIGLVKKYLQDWFSSLPSRPEGTKNIPSGTSDLAAYFMKKGKKVTRNDLQKLADILDIKTPGAASYDTWGKTLKNKILSTYKAYGFSKGGVVRRGIPASILDMIGADALIPRGDSTLIGANPGETVLTKEFTDQLKPTVATLNEFNARMAKPITPILPSSSNDTNVNSECNITINVEKINNEQDIKKLAYQIGDIITERNKRDWKKVR